MTAAVVHLDPDARPIPGGWIVTLPDRTTRCVLKRPNGEPLGYAVFSGDSTDGEREPALGYPGSWQQHPEAAIEWARTAPC
jgi:hypothetical protein